MRNGIETDELTSEYPPDGWGYGCVMPSFD